MSMQRRYQNQMPMYQDGRNRPSSWLSIYKTLSTMVSCPKTKVDNLMVVMLGGLARPFKLDEEDLNKNVRGHLWWGLYGLQVHVNASSWSLSVENHSSWHYWLFHKTVAKMSSQSMPLVKTNSSSRWYSEVVFTDVTLQNTDKVHTGRKMEQTYLNTRPEKQQNGKDTM